AFTNDGLCLWSGVEVHASALISAGGVARAVVLSLKDRAADGENGSRARLLERSFEQGGSWCEGQGEDVWSVVHELAAGTEGDGVAAVRQIAAGQHDHTVRDLKHRG